MAGYDINNLILIELSFFLLFRLWCYSSVFLQFCFKIWNISWHYHSFFFFFLD